MCCQPVETLPETSQRRQFIQLRRQLFCVQRETLGFVVHANVEHFINVNGKINTIIKTLALFYNKFAFNKRRITEHNYL